MSSVLFGDLKRMTTDARERKQFSMYRILKFVIILLLIILVLELLYHFVLSQMLVLKNVSVRAEAGVGLAVDQVKKLAGIGEEENFFLLKTDKVAASLEKYPTVKAASVQKHFPDRVNIVLKARKALAVSLVNTDEGSVPVIFDDEGVIFRTGYQVDTENLPVISGLNYPDAKIGMQLPEQVHDYLGQIAELGAQHPELLNLISEFRFVKKGNLFSEVLIYPVKMRVRVRTVPELNVRIIKNMFVVLDTIEKFGIAGKIEEIDLRADEPVYLEREG
ncbi:MAG: FtsQ-type POTRA domain-containing protein [Spirochaetales bacterium]|nr:FtsQ-type POTRA domain-containing protein [Spirochaetales bacterium]